MEKETSQLNSLSGTVSQRVTESLKTAIIMGEYEPGQQLKMKDLVARFGTSQIPIREALQQLQGEGLITIIPQRGAQVLKPDRKFVNEICDLRRALESMLVEKACEQEDLGWVGELEEAEAVYESLVANGDPVEIMNANRSFHKIHHLIANSAEALTILERTNARLTYIWTIGGYPRERMLQTRIEHQRLIKCFQKHDTQGAISAVVVHNRNAQAALLKGMPGE
jgi:DNA-binding GntR family transcriptional regulator